MRISSLIGHLAELLDTVQNSREPADIIVARFFRTRRYLGARDRRFIADHLFGILRDQRVLEALTREILGGPWKEADSRRVPPVAIALVRVARSGTPLPGREMEALRSFWDVLAPGVSWVSSEHLMREATRPPSVDPDPIRHISNVYSMPEYVTREWIERFGEQETGALCAALNEAAPTTARVNTLRCTPDECRATLEEAGLQVRRGAFLPEAIIFARRPPIQTLEPFRRGWFEMQDEGSQIISLFLSPAPGELIVDACAGAGGKALHCAALMKNTGRIIAADPAAQRLHRLKQRARRAGASIIEIPPDGRVPRSVGARADAVLVDAPCSGLGTLRRNPGAKARLTAESSRSYARSQYEILVESARLVRPGGRMLYATCTLVRQENEDIVERFCAAHPEFSVVPVQEAVHVRVLPELPGPYLALTPHQHGTDGFFGALLRRR